jgi:hypothetical protein
MHMHIVKEGKQQQGVGPLTAVLEQNELNLYNTNYV